MTQNHKLLGIDYSIMQWAALDIARGIYPDAIPVLKWAHHPSVSGQLETIWGKEGLYEFPTSSTTMTLSSSDTNDNATGTGARQILINGLSDTFEIINETVALDGQTPVSTVNEFYRINGLFVTDVGSNETNIGNISIGTGTVTNGVPANTYNIISTVTMGRSACGFLTVPKDQTLYMNQLKTDSSSNGRLESQLRVTTNGITTVLAQMDTQGGSFEFNIPIPYAFESGTDLHLVAKLTGTDRPVIGIFCGAFVENHYQHQFTQWQWL